MSKRIEFKKLLVIVLVIVSITGFVFLHRYNFMSGITQGRKELEYTFYVQEGQELSIVRVYTKRKAEKTEKNNNILGKTISFCSIDFDIRSYTSNLYLNNLIEKTVDNITMYYGYTPLFADSIILNSVIVNIQIAVNHNTNRVTVGMPIIFGSY